jgi:hypothetical protein
VITPNLANGQRLEGLVSGAGSRLEYQGVSSNEFSRKLVLLGSRVALGSLLKLAVAGLATCHQDIENIILEAGHRLAGGDDMGLGRGPDSSSSLLDIGAWLWQHIIHGSG